MRPHPRASAQVMLRSAATTVVAVLVALGLMTPSSLQATVTTAAATTSNVVTPGNFTGYGFDQCLAPSQQAMTTWLNTSPFLAVGIYISGNSRACREQPNLTPTWVSTQLAAGWRLLPITLGPQASCSTRFPRYDDDPTISPDPANAYAKARAQGRAEAAKAVSAAQALGIAAGSTLWYDLEAFDTSRTYCRESALRFLSAWTVGLHELGYVSGVYSSAGSGIKILDDARINRPTMFTLPDYIWIARWDGIPNTRTTYISDEGWNPHRRVKQYQGGHNETWGGVTINIDRNFLDVGLGSVAPPETHCGGVRVDYPTYPRLVPGDRLNEVRALKCLLREQGYGGLRLTKFFGRGLVRAVEAYQAAHGFAVSSTWRVMHWRSLHAQGSTPVLKVGSTGRDVRRVQRALNSGAFGLVITGLMDGPTRSALQKWQSARDLPANAIVTLDDWQRLQQGR